MPRRENGRQLTNVDVVTYALSMLGGLEKPVHLEEIAVEAHRLTPGAFRWDLERFAGSVDKDKVRVSLTDAEKPDRGLVASVGITKRGKAKRTDHWRLTAAGAAWVLANQRRLAGALAGPKPQLKKSAVASVRVRLENTELFAEYKRTGSVTRDDYLFADLIECSPDAPRSVVARRVDELRSQLVLLGEPSLLGFLDACAAAHTDMLREARP